MPEMAWSELTKLPEQFKDLTVGTVGKVGVVVLSRPQKLNALGPGFWSCFKQAVQALEHTESVRCILVCGEGRHFCAGIEVSYLAAMIGEMQQLSCPARQREHFRRSLLTLQDTLSCVEQCRCPVIAAVHGACIGGGVDLITACDVRVCSKDATFCVKEVDLGITADLGTLQRLPHIIGHGAASDLAITARTIGCEEALRLGLVTQVLGSSREELVSGAMQLAQQVAAKSPLALVGTKRVLRHTRDHGGAVAAGLEYVATYNAAMLVSEDLSLAMTAPRGSTPVFSKL
ncbi:delta3,5-delta2,4-dienoyl-CoA isomerase [Haematococcus lacustris]